MNQPLEIPDFNLASYQFSAVYNWHVRQPGSDEHAMLTEQIQLHQPLHPDPFGLVFMAAKARNCQRACLWWAEWYPSPLPGVYHSYEPTDEGMYLLIWEQNTPGTARTGVPVPDHYSPFRLLVAEVKPGFPREPDLWQMVEQVLEPSSRLCNPAIPVPSAATSPSISPAELL